MTNKTTKIRFQIKYDSPSYVLRYKLPGRFRKWKSLYRYPTYAGCYEEYLKVKDLDLI